MRLRIRMNEVLHDRRLVMTAHDSDAVWTTPEEREAIHRHNAAIVAAREPRIKEIQRLDRIEQARLLALPRNVRGNTHPKSFRMTPAFALQVAERLRRGMSGLAIARELGTYKDKVYDAKKVAITLGYYPSAPEIGGRA
ncbi:MAG TPA: hypothetical protein VM238_18655 [Phycisphaerae bacterium]|nr:hypothetical protein [Phycisphaerae bacterium]